MEIADILLFGVATVLFGYEAVKTRSLLAAGACAFALDFAIHALIAL